MKQGGDGDGDSDAYAARCPLHPGFIHGLCFRCWAAAAAEETGGGAPAVALGYEVKDDYEEDYDEDYNEDDDDDDDEDAGRSPPGTVAYIHGEDPVLPSMEAATSTVSASHRATLLRERKLILIVDLDHTLLNSTELDDLSPAEQANGLTWHAKGDPAAGLFRLKLDDSTHRRRRHRMLLKLRPFARGFLEQASAMFEMHVYTLGTREYAMAAVELLNPDGVYFGGMAVSRDESTEEDTKSLDVVPGAADDPAAVVILDDTDDVWLGHQDNLIVIDRYLYFASACRTFGYDDIPSLAEHGVDESEHDGSLAIVLGVLRRVHRGFFDGNRADVREVITEVRRQVLPDCRVAFSFLEQVMEDYPQATFSWRLTEALGGVCRKDVDEEVTHVVAEDPSSEKAQWARDNGKFLVSLEWVTTASFRWRRPDELAFPVSFSNLL